MRTGPLSQRGRACPSPSAPTGAVPGPPALGSRAEDPLCPLYLVIVPGRRLAVRWGGGCSAAVPGEGHCPVGVVLGAGHPPRGAPGCRGRVTCLWLWLWPSRVAGEAGTCSRCCRSGHKGQLCPQMPGAPRLGLGAGPLLGCKWGLSADANGQVGRGERPPPPADCGAGAASIQPCVAQRTARPPNADEAPVPGRSAPGVRLCPAGPLPQRGRPSAALGVEPRPEGCPGRGVESLAWGEGCGPSSPCGAHSPAWPRPPSEPGRCTVGERTGGQADTTPSRTRPGRGASAWQV